MIKTEAKLATVMRRIVGRSARVVLGCAHFEQEQKAYTKPFIYLRFNQFCDVTTEATGTSYVQPKLGTKGKSVVSTEERPGRIAIQIDIVSDDYLETQEYRQLLVGGVFEYLADLRVIALSNPKDPNVSMLFKDIAPSLRDFAVTTIPSCEHPLYCGHIEFVLNGFLHVYMER